MYFIISLIFLKTRPNYFFTEIVMCFAQVFRNHDHSQRAGLFRRTDRGCTQLRPTRYICNRPSLADAFAKRMHSRLCALRIYLLPLAS